MTLKQYLTANGLTYDAFAKRIGAANASTVWRYAHGKRIPRRAVMHRITEATDGAVTPADFYSQEAEGEAA